MPDVGEHVIYVYQDENGLAHRQATIVQVQANGHCSLAVQGLGRVNDATLCIEGGVCHGRYYYEE